jgi:hypothetical protein
MQQHEEAGDAADHPKFSGPNRRGAAIRLGSRLSPRR